MKCAGCKCFVQSEKLCEETRSVVDEIQVARDKVCFYYFIIKICISNCCTYLWDSEWPGWILSIVPGSWAN